MSVVKGFVRPDRCSVDGCAQGGAVVHPGYCSMHYQRWFKTGDAGEAAPRRSPKGAGHQNKDGYVESWEPDHPNARKNGTIFQHVQVMAAKVGRPLHRDENVHHLNGIRDDNRPENLELWSTWQPAGQRVADKLRWAKEFVSRYESVRVDYDPAVGLRHLIVDFDGTLAENMWREDNPTAEIGPTMWANVAKLKEALDLGYTFDIHTARGWECADDIQSWLKEHELPVRAVVCGKPLGQAYVDDKAIPADAESWLP